MNQHPPLQAQKSSDFDEFTDVVHRLLNAAWGKDWGTFCEAFPNGTDPSNVKLPAITYSLEEMVPGVISKDGTREIKPRHRHQYRVEGSMGPQTVDIYGRIFDCKVVFEVWEKNNTKATKLAKKFMDFMDMYTGYIKSQGVKEIILEKYNNKTSGEKWRDNVVCRSIQYFVRLESLNEVHSDVIQKVIAIVQPVTDSGRAPNESIIFGNED